MLTAIVVLATISTGLGIGFAARPSGRAVLALVAGAAFFFLAAFGVHDVLKLVAYALVIAAPVAAARMAATKWSTPDDEE